MVFEILKINEISKKPCAENISQYTIIVLLKNQRMVLKIFDVFAQVKIFPKIFIYTICTHIYCIYYVFLTVFRNDCPQ